jgi:hypothetical protein
MAIGFTRVSSECTPSVDGRTLSGTALKSDLTM